MILLSMRLGARSELNAEPGKRKYASGRHSENMGTRFVRFRYALGMVYVQTVAGGSIQAMLGRLRLHV